GALVQVCGFCLVVAHGSIRSVALAEAGVVECVLLFSCPCIHSTWSACLMSVPSGPAPIERHYVPPAPPNSDHNPSQSRPDKGWDSRGRFTRGNKGGPGNPFNRRVAALRQLLLERVSDDDLAAIVDRLVQQAKEGDLAAAQLLLSDTVGKPLP